MESTSKKRGRPRKWADDELNAAKEQSATRRGRQNYVLAARAIQAIGKDKIGLLPLTVMAELGRLHPAVARTAAAHIITSRLRGRAAVDFARNMRLGNREPDLLKLARAIKRVILTYRNRFPKLTDGEIASAVESGIRWAK